MRCNHARLLDHATCFEFNRIRLIKNPDGSWTAVDPNGFRLTEDGLFIGCPAPAKIGAWVMDTCFSLPVALEALSRRPEVRPLLAALLYGEDEPLHS